MMLVTVNTQGRAVLFYLDVVNIILPRRSDFDCHHIVFESSMLIGIYREHGNGKGVCPLFYSL